MTGVMFAFVEDATDIAFYISTVSFLIRVDTITKGDDECKFLHVYHKRYINKYLMP